MTREPYASICLESTEEEEEGKKEKSPKKGEAGANEPGLKLCDGEIEMTGHEDSRNACFRVLTPAECSVHATQPKSMF